MPSYYTLQDKVKSLQEQIDLINKGRGAMRQTRQRRYDDMVNRVASLEAHQIIQQVTIEGLWKEIMSEEPEPSEDKKHGYFCTCEHIKAGSMWLCECKVDGSWQCDADSWHHREEVEHCARCDTYRPAPQKPTVGIWCLTKDVGIYDWWVCDCEDGKRHHYKDARRCYGCDVVRPDEIKTSFGAPFVVHTICECGRGGKTGVPVWKCGCGDYWRMDSRHCSRCFFHRPIGYSVGKWCGHSTWICNCAGEYKECDSKKKHHIANHRQCGSCHVGRPGKYGVRYWRCGCSIGDNIKVPAEEICRKCYYVAPNKEEFNK